MNGVQRIVSQYITTSPGGSIATSTPVPIGSGDLNGDGAKDIFFLNGNTVTCWYLSVATPSTGPAIVGTATYTLPATTSLNGVADVNGDGVPDFITQNISTSSTDSNRGNVKVYILNPGAIGTTTITSSSSRAMNSQLVSNSEPVMSTVDLNGDNLNDIITRIGSLLYVRYRTIPSGQTVQTTTTFDVAAPVILKQNFSGLPNAPIHVGYSLRN